MTLSGSQSRGLPASAPELAGDFKRTPIHLFRFGMFSHSQKNVAQANLRQRDSILISDLAIRRPSRTKVFACARQVPEAEEYVSKIVVLARRPE